MSSKTVSSRIDPLTSLRFIAATLVIAYHAKGHFVMFDDMPEFLAYTQPVCFFFLLSGFILTYVYRQMDNFAEVKDCWIKRFARIWPLHIAIFVMRYFLFPKYLLTFPGPAKTFLVALSNITMLHAWIPYFQFFFSYNAPSWSISTEFFFYLTFPFVLPYLIKRPLLVLFVSFLINAIAIYACNLAKLPEIFEQGLEMRGILYINPLPRFFEFAAGMCIARLFLGPGQKLKFSTLTATLVEGVVLVLTLALMYYTRTISAQLATIPWIGPAGGYWFINTGVPLLGFALTIFIMAVNQGLFARLFSIAPLVFLGEVSYSIYLLHHPLLCYHGLYFSQYRSHEALILFMVFLLVASHLMYQFVEAPMRNFIIKKGTKYLNPAKIKPEREKEKMPVKLKAIYAAEILFFAVLLCFANPALPSISEDQAKSLMTSQKETIKSRGISFDSDLKLLAAMRNAKNPNRLDLIWQTKDKFKAKQFLNIQYLDKDGNAYFTQVVRLAPGEKKIESGTIWTEEIDLLAEYAANADRIGLVIYESVQAIKSARDDGADAAMDPLPITIDQEGKRLVFNWNRR